MPDEVLGLALATLLISNAEEWKEVRNAANGYLGRLGGLKFIQEKLFEPVQTQLSDPRVCLKVKAGIGDRRRVDRVCGGQFDAPLRGTATLLSLFSGAEAHHAGVDGPTRLVRRLHVELLAIPPGDTGRDAGVKLWRASAAKLIGGWFPPKEPLGSAQAKGAAEVAARAIEQISNTLWEECAREGQLELTHTQAVILGNPTQALLVLGVGREAAHAELRDWVREYEDETRRQILSEHVSGRSSGWLPESPTQSQLRAALKGWLEKESTVGSAIREALRQKLRTHHYDEESVCFELFQNADDATSEAVEMGLELAPGFSLRAEVGTAGMRGALWFAHGGRAINRFKGPSMSQEEGRRRRFDADLEKMLCWGASDKTPESGKVTGQFGLGFKTTLLISDDPETVSGELSFRVSAGIYPVALERERRRELKDFAERAAERLECGPPAADWTATRLRLVEGVEPQRVLQRFKTALPLLLAFGRCLKTCWYEAPSPANGVERFLWQEEAVAGCEAVKRARCEGDAAGPPAYLVMRAPRNVAVVFGLGNRGVQALPEMPSLWVTAPTREKLKCGFAVNGPFCVDGGRADIAGNVERSHEGIDAARRCLAFGLRELWELSESGVPVNVLLAECAGSWTELFGSLWARFTEGEVEEATPAAEIFRRIVWGSRGSVGAFAELIRMRGGLPTGLPGSHDVLTKLQDVKWVARGILDDVTRFERVIQWPGVELKPGRVVSWGRVMEVLSRCWRERPEEPECREYRLLDAAEATIGPECRVDVRAAERLGEILNEKTMREWEWGPFKGEADALRKKLKGFEFECADGSWGAPARMLMLDIENSDESARARWAPRGSILHSKYGAVGREFFKVCRGPLRADADALAEWARRLRKEDGEGRRAVLSYLANGELRGQLGERLGRAGWQPTPEELQALPMDERNRVLGELRLRTSLDGAGPGPAPKPVSRDESKEILRALSEEWKGRLRRDGRVRLEWEIYGEARAGLEGFRDEEQSRRQLAWVTLLVRGAVEKMGRTTPSQHRGFMTLAAEKGWLEAIAEGSLHRGGTSGGIDRYFDEYVDECVDEVKYFEWWLKGLAPLYLYARWLDQYLHALTSATARPRRLDLLLNPRMRPDFSGGGPDAPNLVPALRIGAHFVLRELKRLGVVPDLPDDLCYVPTERLRKRLAQLGAEVPEKGRPEQSKALFEFVKEHLGEEGARFEGWYDVPLQNACPGVSEESGEAEEEDEQ